MPKCEQQPLHDVKVGLGLLEVVAGAPPDHLKAVVPKAFEELLEGELGRLPAAVEREQDRPEGRLERCAPVELGQDGVHFGTPLQLDYEADALAVRFVAHVGHIGKCAPPCERRDLRNQPRLGDGVGQLRDDQPAPAPPHRFGHDTAPHPDASPSGAVHRLDPAPPHYEGTGRKVGAGESLGELLDTALGVLGQGAESRRHLAQIVRGNVRAHPDGDPGAAIDEEVGDARRENGRLLQPVVEVVLPVDGVPVDLGEDLHRRRREARLGVAVRGGRIAIDRAEVPLAIHQRVAEREVLDHPDERAVDGRVAVRVVLAEHLADHGRALLVALSVLEAESVHCHEDSAVDGLEAVADIGQRASHYHAHRVVDERLAHLLLYQARHDAVAESGYGHQASLAGGGRSRESAPGTTPRSSTSISSPTAIRPRPSCTTFTPK